MWSDAFVLYLLTRLWVLDNSIDALLVITSFLIAGEVFFLGCEYADDNEDRAKRWVSALKKTIVAGFCLGILNIIVPSKQDTMVILAGTGVLAAAKSDTAKEIAGKSIQVIEQFLDEQLTKEKK